jgi:hypothetical protein
MRLTKVNENIFLRLKATHKSIFHKLILYALREDL